MGNAALVLLEASDVEVSKRATLKLICANSDCAPQVSYDPTLKVVALIIALQILDGLLTLTGTYTLGINAEGNPLLKSLMLSIGLVPALLLTKGLCVGIVLTLYLKARAITWLPTALRFVALFYTLGAVLPWSLILYNEYLG
jgi:hypothetical protein